jgi:hypothetical protein
VHAVQALAWGRGAVKCDKVQELVSWMFTSLTKSTQCKGVSQGHILVAMCLYSRVQSSTAATDLTPF